MYPTEITMYHGRFLEYLYEFFCVCNIFVTPIQIIRAMLCFLLLRLRLFVIGYRAMTISEDTREGVVQAYLSGKGSMPYIAEMPGVSLPYVKKWVLMYGGTGTYMTGKVSPASPRLYTQEEERAIPSFCTEQTSLTIVGASLLLEEKTKTYIHASTVINECLVFIYFLIF